MLRSLLVGSAWGSAAVLAHHLCTNKDTKNKHEHEQTSRHERRECQKKLRKHFKKLKRQLSKLNNVTALTQSDFDTGTYRIQTSGVYRLLENILFNPTSTRADLPSGTGWFAAITVETDNVVIDLNGFEIVESLPFYNAHVANVFAQIELDNSPFPGDKNGVGFGPGGSTFADATKFVWANNVWIKNGSLGLSGHWGVHGARNNNIIMEDMRIHDFEVSGIEMDGTQYLYLNRLDVSGIEHVITVRQFNTSVTAAVGILEQINAAADGAYNTYLANLITFYETNATPVVPIWSPENATYGIDIKAGFSNYNPVIATPASITNDIQFIDSSIVRHVLVEHVFVHDIVGAPAEVPVVGSNENNLPVDFGQFGVFGLIRWSDLFASDGSFSPNAFAQALALIDLFFLSTITSTTPVELGSTPMTSNTGDILTAILTGNSQLFFANAVPILGFSENNGFPNAGVFGMRIQGAEDVVFGSKVVIESIRNLAANSIALSSLPGYSSLPTTYVPAKNVGFDSYGMTVMVTNEVDFTEPIQIANVSSVNGDEFGLAFQNNNYNTHVVRPWIERVIGYGFNPESIVHPFSLATGIIFQTESVQGIDQMIASPLNFNKHTLHKHHFGNVVIEPHLSDLQSPLEPKQLVRTDHAQVEFKHPCIENIVTTILPLIKNMENSI